MNDGLVVLFLAGEDRQHRQVAGGLADRVFRDRIDWLADVDLDLVRRWQGRDAGDPYYRHKDARDDAAALGFRAHGFIDGKPAGPEAHWLRCVIEVARAASPDAVVIVRDIDRKPERRDSFDTIMRCFPPPFPVVYAGPKQEIEAWIIAGYEPADGEEQARLDTVVRELGFTPVTEPERLPSTSDGHSRDTKKICDHLTAGSPEREAMCLEDLERLRSRGEGCGVTAYLEAVEQELVPIVRAPLRAGRK